MVLMWRCREGSRRSQDQLRVSGARGDECEV